MTSVDPHRPDRRDRHSCSSAAATRDTCLARLSVAIVSLCTVLRSHAGGRYLADLCSTSGVRLRNHLRYRDSLTTFRRIATGRRRLRRTGGAARSRVRGTIASPPETDLDVVSRRALGDYFRHHGNPDARAFARFREPLPHPAFRGRPPRSRMDDRLDRTLCSRRWRTTKRMRDAGHVPRRHPSRNYWITDRTSTTGAHLHDAGHHAGRSWTKGDRGAGGG